LALLSFLSPKEARRRRRLWLKLLGLKLRYAGVILGRESQQSFLDVGIGLLGKLAAAFCLFFQGS